MASLLDWGKKKLNAAYHGISPFDGGQGWTSVAPAKKPQQQQSRPNLDLRPQGSGNPFQNAQPQIRNKPVSQQQDDHENLFESVVKGLVQSEATAAKGIARVLPGGMNDINAQAKAVDEANKFMKQTIADKRAGKINAEQANKLISLALDESNRSHKELTGTINDMPDRGDLAAGFAGTALDIATAGSYSRLKAGSVIAKPGLTKGKDLVPLIDNPLARHAVDYGSFGAAGAANAMAGDGDTKSVLTNTVAGVAFPAVLKVGGKAVGYGINKLRPNIDPKAPGIEPDLPTPPKPPARPMSSNDLDKLNALDKQAKEQIMTRPDLNTRANLQAQKDAITVPAEVQPPVAPQVPGQPVNNLGDALNMERLKNPNAVEPPKITPEAKRVQDVNSLSNEEFSSQLQKDLGISKNKADQLVKNNNKPALHTNLYGSKEKIKTANSPDAYATTVMNQANKRGQAALAQGAPPKPPVKNGGVAPEAPVPPKTLYHSTSADLQGDIRPGDGVMGKGVYLHEKPNVAKEAGAAQTDGNMADQTAHAFDLKGKKIYEAGANYPDPKQIEAIKKQGYDGIRIKGGEHIIFDPKNLTKKNTTNLGKISEDFYDSKVGNKKISFSHLKKLGNDVAAAIDQELKNLGTDYKTVAKKVHAGARDKKVTTLEQAGLTKEEASVIRRAQAEMNYVRRRASLGKKEVGQGDFGELYLPQQKAGQYKGESLFEGFRQTKPGNEFKRQNKIDANEIDYDTSTIAEYIPRYADTKLYREERIAKAFEKNNPQAAEEQINKAAGDFVQLQNEINGLKFKIGLGGFGRTKVHFEGKTVDSTSRLSQMGRDLGKKQVDITETPSGLTNGDKLDSVDVGPNQPLGDYLGHNQHRDAESYANSQVKNAAGNRTKLVEQVQNRLSKDYDLPEDTVKYMTEHIQRIKPNTPDELVAGELTQTYRNAATQQLLENSQRINIKDPTLKRIASELTNEILRQGSMERQLSAKAVSATLKTTNALFRKLNVSSSLNELSDLSAIVSYYGRKTEGIPNFKLIEKYGMGKIDPAIAPYIKATEQGKSLKSILSTIDDKTNLYSYVEHYKAAVMASTGENFYKDLSGDALTKRILKDYRDLVLPVDAFTKTFFDHAPLYTQYMSWAARNLQKEFRLATGKLDGGVMANKNQSQRVMRNLYANLPAKTVFWLASNGLKGTPILVAFGLNDWTGLSNPDYSGIQDQDKGKFDKYVAPHAGVSTTLGIASNIYQGIEKDKLKNDPKYKDPAEYNPYKYSKATDVVKGIATPQGVKNVVGVPFTKTKDSVGTEGALQLQKKGYSENKSGGVQFEAPTDKFNQVKSYVFGKNQTTAGREYSGRQNIVDRLKKGDNLYKGVTDMAKEQLTLKDSDYKRPLNKDYSEAYKSLDKTMRTDILKGGRTFNGKLDDLKKKDPTNYNRYISDMDGNHVSPEFWRQITGGGATNNADLKIFGTMRERKKQLKADMDKTGMNKNGKYNYDPIYDLNDQQARQVLQQKSTMTGDDLALRNILYKEAWYKDYQQKTQDFYKNKPADDKVFKETPRVKEWNKYNTEYNDLSGVTGDREAKEYPLVHQLKQYEYGSQESKDFLKNNYDAWKAQRDAVDTKKLELINKMRKIEGGQPMSLEAYQQATNVKDTSGNDKNSGYGRGDFIPKLEFMSLQKTKIAAPKGVKVKAPTYKGTKGGVKKASIAKIRSNVNSKKLG